MADTAQSPALRLRTTLRSFLLECAQTAWELVRIMVPISIATRVLKEIGAIDLMGQALAPVMHLVGLPGSMGLVWATGMISQTYGAIVVFISLAPEADLTVAQVTTVTTMLLVAHALPIELRIAQRAGARLRVMLALRIAGALAIGWLLHIAYSLTGWLQQPSRPALPIMPEPETWGAWAAQEARNYVLIFGIIFVLFGGMRVLRKLRLLDALAWVLERPLRLLGMSRQAAPITVVGMTLGLTYGGGLIINDARSGRLTKRDVFFSLALMGLCHSLIEDTLLMMALGAHHSGVFWGRLAFALVVTMLLARVLRHVPEAALDRYCFRSDSGKPSR